MRHCLEKKKLINHEIVSTHILNKICVPNNKALSLFTIMYNVFFICFVFINDFSFIILQKELKIASKPYKFLLLKLFWFIITNSQINFNKNFQFRSNVKIYNFLEYNLIQLYALCLNRVYSFVFDMICVKLLNMLQWRNVLCLNRKFVGKKEKLCIQ